MINNLEIIKYLTLNDIVSQNKLEKQLYLVDWFNCLKYDSQLSNFEWKSDDGPRAKGLNKLINDISLRLSSCKAVSTNTVSDD